MRQRLRRPLRDGVEPAVVLGLLAEAPRSVRLPRKHDRGGVRGALAQRHNPPLVEHSSSSPCDHRFIGRERGIGFVPVAMRSSKARPRSGDRPGGGSASKSAYSPASMAKSGGSPSSAGSVNAGPSAANEIWPTSSTVGERRAGVGKAGQRVLCPCGSGHRPIAASAATADRCPAGAAQRDGRPSVGISRRQTVSSSARASAGERLVACESGASRVRSRRTRRPDVQPRSEVDRIRFVKEVEVVRAQPVVAEDDIRVAVHVQLHKRRLLVKAAEQQLLHRGAALLAQRAVRLPHGGRVPRRRCTPARNRELRRQLAAQKAVRRAGVQEALDPPSPGRSDDGRSSTSGIDSMQC